MADNILMTLHEKWVAILALSARGKTPTKISSDLGMSRKTVYRTVKRGTVKTPKRVRTRPARPLEVMEAIKYKINEKNAKVTIKGLAHEMDMSKTTMRRLVHDDLGLKSYKRMPRQALKPIDCKKRLVSAKKCLNLLKKKPARVVILHLDETPFSLDEMVASETGFYLAEACGDTVDSTVHYGKERHFANLQVIATIWSDGQKCDLVFLEAGERLNSITYLKYLRTHIFPWVRTTYGEAWWLHQDGASCHTSKTTQMLPDVG